MTYKKCTCCGENKPISDYYLTGRYTKAGVNIPRAKCKKCVQGVKTQRRQNIRAWLKQYKRNSACAKCGYSKETHADFTARALEFHHPQDNKEFAIGEAPAKGMAIESIKKEIDKCVVLCARCHMEIHNK
jgi:hypothetical protein